MAALDHEQLPLALAFLAGYQPRIFDAVLEAAEPATAPARRKKHQAESRFA